jgi:hypothetical protein
MLSSEDRFVVGTIPRRVRLPVDGTASDGFLHRTTNRQNKMGQIWTQLFLIKRKYRKYVADMIFTSSRWKCFIGLSLV